MSVKVVGVFSTRTDCEPENAREPVHSESTGEAEASQDVAYCVVQLRVVLAPIIVTTGGLAVIVTRGRGGNIVSKNVSLLVKAAPGGVPITVIVYEPIGEASVAEIVSTELQVGLHETGENELVTLAGKPEADKLTKAVEVVIKFKTI